MLGKIYFIKLLMFKDKNVVRMINVKVLYPKAVNLV